MDAPSGGPASYEFADYAALVRRRGWVIALGLALGLSLAMLYLQVAPKEYTSTASVLVTPTGAEQAIQNQNGRTEDVINLDTEAQLVRSAVIATAAQKLLSSRLSPAELIERVEATVPPNTSVLDITYTASTPGEAQRGARAFAQAYLDSRTAAAVQATNRRVAALQKQIAQANASLKRLAGQIAALPENSPDRFTAQAQQRVVQDSLTSYNQRLSPLLSTDITPGRVITDAELPKSPSNPVPTIVLGSGLLVGLLLGLAAALLLERTDHRVRRASEVERLLDLPVLLEVPRTYGKGPMGLLSFRSEGGQAFRRLRNDVVSAIQASGQVVLVAGASEGHASGAVAANLATALARTEDKVVLLCADLRSADAAMLLGVPAGPGLSDVLLDRLPASSVVRRSQASPGLAVLAPGTDGPLASDRRQTEAMEQLVASLRSTASYVVIEAPPTSAGADAQALAPLVDAAILVVESRRTRREEILEGALQIDRMATPLLGAVVVPYQGRAGRKATEPASIMGGDQPEGGDPAKDTSGDAVGPDGTAGEERQEATADREAARAPEEPRATGAPARDRANGAAVGVAAVSTDARVRSEPRAPTDPTVEMAAAPVERAGQESVRSSTSDAGPARPPGR